MAGEKEAAASGNGGKGGTRRFFGNPERGSLVRGLILNVCLVVVPISIYSFVVVERQARIDSQRSFRALAEVQRQFDNYLEAASNLFELVPSQDSSPDKISTDTASRDKDKDKDKDKELIQSYHDSIALPGLDAEMPATKLPGSSLSELIRSSICKPRFIKGVAWLSQDLKPAATSGKFPSLHVFSCEQSSTASAGVLDQAGKGALPPKGPPIYKTSIYFSIDMSRAIDVAERMSEFEQVIVTTDSGIPLAVVSHAHSRIPRERLTQQAVEGIDPFVDTAALLRAGAQDDGATPHTATEPADGKGGAKADGASDKAASRTSIDKAPGRVVAIQQKIGEEDYAAYISPYTPTIPILHEIADPKAGADSPCDKPTVPAGKPAASRGKGGITQSPAPVAAAAADPLSAEKTGTAGCRRIGHLYFIGLRQRGKFAVPIGSFDPMDAWYLTLATLGLLLLAPFARLVFLETHDFIRPIHARAIAFCAVAFGALLAVGLISGLADHALLDEADQGARSYADSLRKTFTQQMDEMIYLLRSAQSLTDSAYKAKAAEEPMDLPSDKGSWSGFSLCPNPAPTHPADSLDALFADGERKFPLRQASPDDPAGENGALDGAFRLSKTSRGCFQRTFVKAPLRSGGLDSGELRDWSPAHSLIWLKQDGEIGRNQLSAFAYADKYVGHLDSRPYFRILHDGGGWPWSCNNCSAQTFSAQRLFNKADGAKLLQVAIPLFYSDGIRDPTFRGALTGDLSLYPFSAAVPPLNYGFAIVDNETGTVLFHDDDVRSLAENFYLETENDPQLLAAIHAQRPGSLLGEYRGMETGFYVAPLQGVPWSVVVTYPLEPLHAVTLFSGLQALALYAGGFLFCSALYLLVLSLASRKNKWAWPQWRLRNAYSYMAALYTAFLFFEILVLSVMTPPMLIPCLLLCALFVPAAGSAMLSTSREQTSEKQRIPLLFALLGVGGNMLLAGAAIVEADGYDPGLWLWALGTFIIVLLAWLLLRTHRRGVPRDESGTSRSSDARLLRAFLAATPLVALALIVACHAAGWRSTWQAAAVTGAGLLVIWLLMYGWHRISAGDASAEARLVQDIWKIDSPISVQPTSTPRIVNLRYQLCTLLLVTILGAVPAAALLLHSLAWQVQGFLLSGLKQTAESLERRTFVIDHDMRHLVPDEEERTERFPSSWILASYLATPGVDKVHVGNSACLLINLSPSPVDKILSHDSCERALARGDSGLDRTADPIGWVGALLSGSNAAKALQAQLDIGSHLARENSSAPNQLWIRHTTRGGGQIMASLNLPQASGLSLMVPVKGVTERDWSDQAWFILLVAGFVLPVFVLAYSACHYVAGSTWLEKPGEPPKGVPLGRMMALFPDAPRLLYMDFDALKLVQPKESGRREPLTLQRIVEQLPEFAAEYIVDLAIDNLDEIDPGRRKPWAKAPDTMQNWLFRHLDTAVVQGEERRLQVLRLLERAIAAPRTSLFITTEFSPVAALRRAGRFPEDDAIQTSDSEAARWMVVFSRLRVHLLGSQVIAPTPSMESRREEDSKLPRLLYKVGIECQLMWPKLYQLRQELQNAVLNGRVGNEDDIEQMVYVHAESLYSRLWKQCTVHERLAMYQLADGHMLNPQNEEILQRLIRRGIVGLRPEPRLISDAFRRFILGAESRDVYDDWQEDAETGIWQKIRIPLLLVLLMLTGWLAYSGGDVFNTLTAVLASTVLFAGNAFRIFGLVRGSPGGAAGGER